MSGLQKFMDGRNGRTASPQHGQPAVNPNRLAAAANARVPMKAHIARPPTAQTSQGLPGRGESMTQSQSAFMQQQHLQRRPSGEGRIRDPYDTDAESIDTTVNHSVVQVENTQAFDQQQFQPFGQQQSEPTNQEDESGDDEEEDEFDSQAEFPEHVQQYLDETGYAEASYDEQIQWLQETRPGVFQTVDGDSYPTTTEGNPTEVDEQQEQPGEHPDPPSPSPGRPTGQGQPPSVFNQQPQRAHHALDTQHINPVPQQTSRLYQQGAQLRGQQRLESTAHGRSQSGQQRDNVEPPTSQPPSYSQTTREHGSAGPSAAHARPGTLASGAQSSLPQRSSRIPPAQAFTQNPIPRIAEPATTFKRVSATRTKAVPITQPSVEPAAVEPPVEEQFEHVVDYDPEILSQMKYEELRDESFDKDPREQELSLPEDICEKPLAERLQFAQQKLDPTGQAKFFRALPTTEWEEAGDWFLDQFSKIITRTREARQKKRKEAQCFEKGIEDRHQHVAKKQRLVEGAMAKMQAQGEGLVPKSPRASKSPRPRRG
ncbi:hypothetical protein E8E11_003445 [Didymella keratinophila]|nr:hypothetical protein E8E11_003445 [Didymella keratinophila]